MNKANKYWLILGISIFVAFFILGWFGRELYRKIPPIPQRVISTSGEILMTKDDILRGQQVWQSIGGQQVGSIWGHGAYQAPDWSADWLHRESVVLRRQISNRHYAKEFEDLTRPQQAAVEQLLMSEMRANTYDKDTQTVIISAERAAAIAETAAHYDALFVDDPDLRELRESYAIHESARPQRQRRKAIANFFFWTSWAAATQRPNMDVTYTNNWPHEPLVGNHPTPANLIWSLISIACLIAGIGALVWYKTFRDKDDCPQSSSDRFDADHGKYSAWFVVRQER
ncbi:MAG: hypothetical protein PVI71_05370 [Desulfobacterales bacterium]|jgi:nitric oxide reductase subunit B